MIEVWFHVQNSCLSNVQMNTIFSSQQQQQQQKTKHEYNQPWEYRYDIQRAILSKLQQQQK